MGRYETAVVRVTLRWQLAGGVLTLIATTQKRGESLHDAWSVSPSLGLVSATIVSVSRRGEAIHLSRATVAGASLAADTTYTFSYAIVMLSGERVWAGSGSAAITLGPGGPPARSPVSTRVTRPRGDGRPRQRPRP